MLGRPSRLGGFAERVDVFDTHCAKTLVPYRREHKVFKNIHHNAVLSVAVIHARGNRNDEAELGHDEDPLASETQGRDPRVALFADLRTADPPLISVFSALPGWVTRL